MTKAMQEPASPAADDAAPQLVEQPLRAVPHETLPSKPIRARFVPDEFFGHQPTSRSRVTRARGGVYRRSGGTVDLDDR